VDITLIAQNSAEIPTKTRNENTRRDFASRADKAFSSLAYFFEGGKIKNTLLSFLRIFYTGQKIT
jgi:hypothetical protein